MNKISKIDAAIQVVLLTAFCYGISYAYLLGYYDYFNMPYMFIELNRNTMATPLLIISLFLGVGYMSWHNAKVQSMFLNESLKVTSHTFPQGFLKVIQDIKNVPKQIADSQYAGILPVVKLMVKGVILGVLILLSLATAKLGSYMASEKTEYMVIKQKEDAYVAVTSFKDLVIVAPLNVKKESIKPEFEAIEIKELKDTEIVYFKNGLKVEGVRSSQDLK